MLPVNFHRTFVPERHLVGALLHYAALGKAGTYQEISADTGIPMGKFTGKVQAILDYARGMGLVVTDDGSRGREKAPVLTPLGRVVYTEDRFLGLELTQWLIHANLCSRATGAAAWTSAFAIGRWVLGSRFSREQLEAYLVDVFGPGNRRTGPLVRTYTDDAALARARVLLEEGPTIVRQKAPLVDSYALPYSAMVLALMETHFGRQTQVTLPEFGETTLWFDICLWEQQDREQLCELLDRKGYVTVDRQMHPWVLERKAASAELWARAYDELV